MSSSCSRTIARTRVHASSMRALIAHRTFATSIDIDDGSKAMTSAGDGRATNEVAPHRCIAASRHHEGRRAPTTVLASIDSDARIGSMRAAVALGLRPRCRRWPPSWSTCWRPFRGVAPVGGSNAGRDGRGRAFESCLEAMSCGYPRLGRAGGCSMPDCRCSRSLPGCRGSGCTRIRGFPDESSGTSPPRDGNACGWLKHRREQAIIRVAHSRSAPRTTSRQWTSSAFSVSSSRSVACSAG